MATSKQGPTGGLMKQATALYGEFQQFAFKGNVVDLAVGFVIGTAFTNVVNSLVKNLLTPLLGLLLPGQQGYVGWKWVINGKEVPYGLFLGELVNFLIVAVAVFLFAVKFLGWLSHLRKEEAKAPQPLTKEQELLTEIRDLLKRERPPNVNVTL
jgi:large conductance mechanosensitive channel